MEPKIKTSDEPLRCSFCNKTQHDVRKLIAGPGPVCICDECVETCVDVLMSGSNPENQPADSTDIARLHRIASKLHFKPKTCGFCGRTAVLEDMLPIEDRGLLCGDCANAIENALANGTPRS